MAGSVGVPTPWWQIEGPVGRDPRAAAQNLIASAPPGYTYDLVKQAYVPIVGSATDALAQRARDQSIQDSLLKTFGAGADALTGAIGGGATTTGSSTFPTVSYDTGNLPAVSWPGGVGTGGGGTGSGGTTQPTAHIQIPDDSAAVLAAYNRAKDQVGRTTSGSLTALRSALASRGILGGGAEVKGTANVLTEGQRQLADTSRTQAINEATRQDDFAKLGYQGAIEQRGQDITTSEGAANRALDAAKAAYSGAITQRGQDVDAAGTKFQGGITMRGQDITAANAAADRAIGARGQNLGALSTLLTKLY